MRVNVRWRSDAQEPLTDPFPQRSGALLRVYAGDYYLPHLRATDWFNPPWPVSATRSKRTFMPFLSWRIGNLGGYIGFKLYGFDSPAYINYPNIAPEDVAPGSLACCLTFRPFANLTRRK